MFFFHRKKSGFFWFDKIWSHRDRGNTRRTPDLTQKWKKNKYLISSIEKIKIKISQFNSLWYWNYLISYRSVRSETMWAGVCRGRCGAPVLAVLRLVALLVSAGVCWCLLSTSCSSSLPASDLGRLMITLRLRELIINFTRETFTLPSSTSFGWRLRHNIGEAPPIKVNVDGRYRLAQK